MTKVITIEELNNKLIDLEEDPKLELERLYLDELRTIKKGIIEEIMYKYKHLVADSKLYFRTYAFSERLDSKIDNFYEDIENFIVKELGFRIETDCMLLNDWGSFEIQISI